MDVVEYDALDRLTRVTRQRPSQPDLVEDYAYNSLGALALNAGVALDMRRPRLDGTGTADSAIPNTFNGQPVVVDAVGRITSLDGMTLAYTRRGQLLSATVGASTATYGFDSFYRRISHEAPGVSEFYILEDENIVATSNGATIVMERYAYDGIDHPLRREAAGQVAYYEIDLANNVRRLRGEGGNDLGGYRYSAFGGSAENTATLAQPMRWKGRWLDALTGLYDVRARQWAANIGSFTAIDEFGHMAPTSRSELGVRLSLVPILGASAEPELVQADLLSGFGFHTPRATLWAWSNENPIAKIDPTGHSPPEPVEPPPTCEKTHKICPYKHGDGNCDGRMRIKCTYQCDGDPVFQKKQRVNTCIPGGWVDPDKNCHQWSPE